MHIYLGETFFFVYFPAADGGSQASTFGGVVVYGIYWSEMK